MYRSRVNSSEAWNTQISSSFSFSCVGADFNGVTNYELFPDVGTETGVCKTIKPIVDFNSKLTDSAAKDAFKIELGSEVLSGESNGLNILLDVETFDHGYVPAKGIIVKTICLKANSEGLPRCASVRFKTYLDFNFDYAIIEDETKIIPFIQGVHWVAS